jgi:hypothetical protein
LLFRLERYGILAPRILAFGRHRNGSGFLLTRPVPDTEPLARWLSANRAQRSTVLRATGTLMRKLHAAGLQVDGRIDVLGVRHDRAAALMGLALKSMPQPAGRWPLRDVGLAVRSLRLGEVDAAQLLRGYLGVGTSMRDGRKMAEALRGQLPLLRGARDA